MSDTKHQNLEQVREELKASPLYEAPVAGQPTLGYLGDLGHRYARPEELTKEALFSKTEAAPLVQSPEQKARARAYEVQMATDNLITASVSSIQSLASRLVSKLIPEKKKNDFNKSMKP